MVGHRIEDDQQHAVGGRSEAGAHIMSDILTVDKHVQTCGWKKVRGGKHHEWLDVGLKFLTSYGVGTALSVLVFAEC